MRDSQFMARDELNKRLAWDAKKIYGATATDWEIGIEFSELRKKRKERLIEKMKKFNMGAIACFSQGGIRYASSTYYGPWTVQFHPGGYYRYCILTRNGELINFELPGNDTICIKRSSPWITEVRSSQLYNTPIAAARKDLTARFANDIKDTLKKYGVVNEILGVDTLDYWGYNALTNAGLKIGDGMEPLMEARMIKFPEEIEILKQAAAIGDAGHERAYEVLKAGMREHELMGEVAKVIWDLGAEFVPFFTIGSGGKTNPFYRVGATDKIIRYGDMVILDMIFRYNGYVADYYRYSVCGRKPTDEQKAMHKEAYDSTHAAIAAIKPGVSTKDVAEVWRPTEGWDSMDSETTTMSYMMIGHGIGLEFHEWPIISLGFSPNFPMTLEENMCLAVETYGGKLDGKEGARVEEEIVITDKGTEKISLAPYHDFE